MYIYILSFIYSKLNYGSFMSHHTMKALMKLLCAYDSNELCRARMDTDALLMSVHVVGGGINNPRRVLLNLFTHPINKVDRITKINEEKQKSSKTYHHHEWRNPGGSPNVIFFSHRICREKQRREKSHLQPLERGLCLQVQGLRTYNQSVSNCQWPRT